MVREKAWVKVMGWVMDLAKVMGWGWVMEMVRGLG
jgi:hypothetical protein